jgi:crotonobetainyl-CoA:carnitine CoA-transferase CaiB-like acyl-CoA transferase
MVLAVGADRQWERFCRAVGQDAWSTDARFRTNPDRVQHRDELTALLRPLIASRPTAQWLKLLEAAEVPCARIATVDEAASSAQSQARGMVQQVKDEAGRELRLLGNPIRWTDRPDRNALPPPELGRHTDTVLDDWLHYTSEQIALLRRQGVIA